MVSVHPPIVGFLGPERAEELASKGLFADDLEGLASAWRTNGQRWTSTVTRARALPSEQLAQRVDGEWAFVETLRHLIFVTDTWVGDVIEESSGAYHPWGLPPDFFAHAAGPLGLAVDATPAFDEVLAVREARSSHVAEVLERLDPADLQRTCVPRDGQFLVVGALQAVVFEEWAHHEYATRDLTTIEADHGA